MQPAPQRNTCALLAQQNVMVSGEGAAFEYVVGLSSCMPGELGASCLTVACALRLIMLSECSTNQSVHKELLKHSSLKSTLDAMISVTGKKNSLPGTLDARKLLPVTTKVWLDASCHCILLLCYTTQTRIRNSMLHAPCSHVMYLRAFYCSALYIECA